MDVYLKWTFQGEILTGMVSVTFNGFRIIRRLLRVRFLENKGTELVQDGRKGMSVLLPARKKQKTVNERKVKSRSSHAGPSAAQLFARPILLFPEAP